MNRKNAIIASLLWVLCLSDLIFFASQDNLLRPVLIGTAVAMSFFTTLAFTIRAAIQRQDELKNRIVQDLKSKHGIYSEETEGRKMAHRLGIRPVAFYNLIMQLEDEGKIDCKTEQKVLGEDTVETRFYKLKI